MRRIKMDEFFAHLGIIAYLILFMVMFAFGPFPQLAYAIIRWANAKIKIDK